MKRIGIIIITFFLLAACSFSINKKAYAYLDSGIPCRTSADCPPAEGYKAFCINGMCGYNLINSLDKSIEKVQQCDANGTINQECYIIGTLPVNPTDGFGGVIGSLTDGLTVAVAGTIPTEAQTGQLGAFKSTGAVGSLASLTSEFYRHPPASGVEYLAYLGEKFGITKTVYAQGVGFNSFSPMLKLWRAARNIAYILCVLVFLVAGLMIMFRVKISPQATITIQNAIPRIVIALVLVTFSYAIVGLLVDLVYVIINFVIAALGSDLVDITQEQSKYSNLAFTDIFSTLLGSSITGLVGLIVPIMSMGILGIIAKVVSPWLGIGVAGLPILIISVIILYSLFRLFFALLSCYIAIVLSLISAPILILLGALPNSQIGFKSWFSNLLANILVFPAVSLVVLLGWLLVAQGQGPTWRPPALNISGGGFTTLVGLGVLLLLPKIPDIIKNAFKIKPAGYGQAIGQALAPVKTAFYMGASEAAGTGGWLEHAHKGRLAMGIRKVAGLK